MIHYQFRVEGRLTRGNLQSGVYNLRRTAVKFYIAENKEQARTLAEMDNITPRRVARVKTTKEPLDRRVEDIKEINSLKVACIE